MLDLLLIVLLNSNKIKLTKISVSDFFYESHNICILLQNLVRETEPAFTSAILIHSDHKYMTPHHRVF